MAKRNIDSKTFARQKRNRRGIITFWRMVRYGVNNLTRNAWLTIAATVIMTITLLIIFASVATRTVLNDTIDTFSQGVDMSLYLQTSAEEKDIEKIQNELKELDTVRSVSYLSPAEQREAFAARYKNNPAILESLQMATNRFSGTIRVNLYDIENTSELEKFADTNETYNAVKDPAREPSFAGDRKAVIDDIASRVGTFQTVGYVLLLIFVAISILVVFNTIRMAIFNRKEEIYMMKLIGADKSFIRGPFVVEAISYGMLAALLATVLGVVLLSATSDGLVEFGLTAQPTIEFMRRYIVLVLAGMMTIGAIIGVISSMLATQRYLKI